MFYYIRLKKSFTEVKKSQWPKKEERKGKPNEDKKKTVFLKKKALLQAG